MSTRKEVTTYHQLLASQVIQSAIEGKKLPAAILRDIGSPLGSGSPSWHYVLGRLAYAIAQDCPKANQLVTGSSPIPDSNA